MKKNVERLVVILVTIVCGVGVVGAMVWALSGAGGGDGVGGENSVDNVDEAAERQKTQAEIDNDDESIPTAGAVVDFAIDIRNPREVAEHSTNVALVRIEEITGFSNYSEIYAEYSVPYTYGKMRVLENYKGELPTDRDLKFYRNGGVLTAEQYYAGKDEGLRVKYAELNVDDPGLWTKKTRYTSMGDIRLEVGKTYLVYLVPEGRHDTSGEAYGMIAAEGGLREVRKDADGEWSEVLNNFTGEWEELSKIVELK